MTQKELEAGADAVGRVAQKYGVANWLTRDHLREIAAEVIAAHDRVDADAAEALAVEAARMTAAKKAK